MGTDSFSCDRDKLYAFSAAMLPLDEDGRIRGGSVHLHVLRSAQAVVCRTHAALPEALHDKLVLRCNAPRGRPRQWGQDYAQYIDALASFATLSSIRAGLVYSFPETISVSDSVVSVTAENAELLAGGLDEWIPDAKAGVPMMAVVNAGQAVAICASVKVAGGIHCAGVETIYRLRGHGVGTRAVRAWAGMVRSLDAEPLYATTFDNIASQSVARSLALRPVCSEFSAECRRDSEAHSLQIS